MYHVSISLHNSTRTHEAAQLTFAMPEALDVVEDLFLSLEPGEPKYKSFFRFTAGVASSAFFCVFWHLAQTILS